MPVNTPAGEEFKKALKKFFSEKKKVKELQQKFQAKLSDIHKLSITEEYAHLKNAYLEKEKQCQEMQAKLESLSPLVKKVIEELKIERSTLQKKEEELCFTKKRIEKQQERYDAQLKQQGETIKGLHEEIRTLHKNYEEKLKRQAEEIKHFLDESAILKQKLSSKQFAIYEEHEEKIHHLERGLKNIQNGQFQLIDQEPEILKAKLHLVKKIKEVAFLHEVVKKQKEQILALQLKCQQKK